MILAATDFFSIYCGGVFVLCLVAFVLIIAWVTRATAVASLAVGIGVVGGFVLATASGYLTDADWSADPMDKVLLRAFAALGIALTLIGVLVAFWCQRAERAHAATRAPATPSFPTATEAFDQAWVLSLLQRKMRERQEKVSTSATTSPTVASASVDHESSNPL